jgi:DNA topoisomerase I
MSNNTYCFNILNPSNRPLETEDIDAIKAYIEELYTKGRNSIEKVPGSIFRKEAENKVCVYLATKNKKIVEAVEKRNESIHAFSKHKPGNVFQVGDLYLEPPQLFEIKEDKWWDGVEISDPTAKWTSLIHNGPCFPHLIKPYVPVGNLYLKIYDKKIYLTNPNDEKLSLYYAKRKIQDRNAVYSFTSNDSFNKNFFKSYKKQISPGLKSQIENFYDFLAIDWQNLIDHVENSKIELSTEEKNEKQVLTLENRDRYGYAYVDGKVMKVGNFLVEQGGIFLGHPDQKTGKIPPNSGKIKKEIFPEDVVINCGKDDPIPVPPEGHRWAGVEHHTDKIWLSKYLDSVTGKWKYIFFGNEGKFKGQNEMKKFVVARELNFDIEKVRQMYEKDAALTKPLELRQLATVLYLIDHFGLRVGGEKDLDKESDTIGASTLKASHVNILKNNVVNLHFSGKDGIEFDKNLKIDNDLIYRNLKEFKQKKSRNEDTEIFDLINTSKINAYIKNFNKNYSAKVFRTRLASSIMFAALENTKIPMDVSKADFKLRFNKANAKVAEVLNHSRNLTKKARETLEKMKNDLKDLKKEKKKIEKEGKSTVAIDKKIKTKETNIKGKEDVKNVAISTSLTNYIDPRIIVSWIKNQKKSKKGNDHYPVDWVYSKQLMERFKWAIEETEKEWTYDLITESENNRETNIDEEEEEDEIEEEEEDENDEVEVKEEEIIEVQNPLPKEEVIAVNYVVDKNVEHHINILKWCENPNDENESKVRLVPRNIWDWLVPEIKNFIDQGINVDKNKKLMKIFRRKFASVVVDKKYLP